jgi:hypothetical protein
MEEGVAMDSVRTNSVAGNESDSSDIAGQATGTPSHRLGKTLQQRHYL